MRAQITLWLSFMMACSQSKNNDEPSVDNNGNDTSAQSQNTTDDALREPMDCPVEDIYGGLPTVWQGSTLNGSNSYGNDCDESQSEANDLAFRWEAPLSGQYKFDTTGSNFDTIVALYSPNCDAEELQCNDDYTDQHRQSITRRWLDEGEQILIVVDGYSTSDQGDVYLQIDHSEMICEDGLDDDNDGLIDCDDEDCADTPKCTGFECPSQTLSNEIPSSANGNTTGESLLGDASCSNGGGNAPEATFSFKAPHTGTFFFDTSGSDFDTLLYLREGYCTGMELACDDDSGEENTSRIGIDLQQGQTIIVVVDGYGSESGSFSLTVEGLELVCDDGADNDGDGLIDCDDDDCLSVDCITGGQWPNEWSSIEEEMLDEVNLRRALGATCDQDYYPPAAPLEMNSYLRLSSRLHSWDMATNDYFEHTGLDGRSADDRMRDAGFTGDYPTGENISAGYGTVVDSVDGLMNSPGHCRNIMNPEYTVVGYGFAYDGTSSYGRYYTQNFGGSH